MTQYDDDDLYDRGDNRQGAAVQPSKPNRLRSVLGALAALVISAGLVVWAFHLGGQEARNIPVIKVGGLVREAPAVRGGEKYSDQNRAVYQATGDQQSGVGEAGRAPNPEHPAQSDLAQARAQQSAGSIATALSDPPSTELRHDIVRLDTFRARPGEEPDSGRSVTQPPNVGTGALASARMATPAEQGGAAPAGQAAMQPVMVGTAPPIGTGTGTGQAVAPVGTNPVTKAPSAQPQASKAQVAVTAKPAPATPAPAAPARATPDAMIDPTTPWQVQVAAVGSQAEAVARWQKVQAQGGAAMVGLAAEVQEAEVNGRRVFRLRLGPTKGRDDAQRICDRLKKSGVDCFVAKR